MSRPLFTALLVLVVLVVTAPLHAEPGKREHIRVCSLPHGPGVTTWTYYINSDEPAFGRAFSWVLASPAWVAVYHHDPNAPPETRARLPIKYKDAPCVPAPPKVEPKPAPVVQPAKKQEPVAKKKAEGTGGGQGKKGDGNGGGGRDEESVEARVAKKRLPQTKEAPRKKAKPKETVLTEERLLPSEGVLSQESILPGREEVPRTWVDEEAGLEDQGGALPVQHHRPGQALWSVASCDTGKEECKGEGKGKGDDKEKETEFDKFAQELALAAGLVSLEPGHDLHREDGKKYGIVGGENEDGWNLPELQAAVAFLQLSSAVRAQVRMFDAKLKEAGRKKLPLVIEKTEELSKEAIEYLRKKYGAKKLAGSLADMQVIGPYDVMSQFTDGLGGAYQAHHILEEAMASKLGLTKELDKIPSVILTEAEHKRITKLLKDMRPKKLDRRTLWKLYEDVYEPFPHWLEAVKPYFGK